MPGACRCRRAYLTARLDAVFADQVRCQIGMASIAAWWEEAPGPHAEECVRRLVRRAPLDRDADHTLWCAPGVVLGAAWPHRRASAYAASGDLHVVIDGRLDDASGLSAAIAAAGHAVPRGASAAQLLAGAYSAWGPSCFARCSGEFSACLWDARLRTLSIARDRFGVKPLFYAPVSGGAVVSSSLEALRSHLGGEVRWVDEAIGDFLLFGSPQDPAATCFAGIYRVPPSCCVTFGAQAHGVVTRYWHLEAGPTAAFKDPRDHVASFRDTLSVAVRERMGEHRTTILMSGGLDSSSIAALATEAAKDSSHCTAVTAVYDRLFADEERSHSTTVARFLRMPIAHVPVDDHALFEGWFDRALPPEPSTEVLWAIIRNLHATALQHADVALGGDGGDPALLPGAVVRHLGRAALSDTAWGLWQTWRRGLWPPLGLWSGAARRWGRRPEPPRWLSTRLSRAYDPSARWQTFHAGQRPVDAPRGEALRVLGSPVWGATFEMSDPNTTGLALEPRYPYFDARVLACCLRLPSYPWCVNKTIVREAMVGRLPEAIRVRPKTPLAGDPVTSRGWSRARLLALVRETPGLDEHVDVAAVAREVRDEGLFSDHQPGTLALAALATWMRASAGMSAS